MIHMNTGNNDTIAAISTPLGEGGIGIVRLSGDGSFAIVEKIFNPSGEMSFSSCASHTVWHGYIKTPGSGKVIDEVLVTVMRSPRTYTKEDIVEISCHGGIMPLKNVLEICLREGGRLAEPGEFTKRAFLNGRLDLSQAEAVLDIIKSGTDVSQRIAVEQLKGTFSREIRRVRDGIIEVLSRIELSIDFSQEDVEFQSGAHIIQSVNDIYRDVENILKTSEKGILLKTGASVVICGRPNVGKSSLMNALLRHDRVIVTPVAGTTRDVIEENINIGGVKVKVSDTAGIIETRDRVEIEGIKRSREKLAGCDIVVFMLDRNSPLSRKDEEIYGSLKDKKVVIVANKSDLPCELDIKKARLRLGSESIIEVSALKKEGLDKVEDAIADKLFNGKTEIPEGPIVTNIRHRDLLKKTEEILGKAGGMTAEDYNPELLASDLNEAVHWLGFIIGESVGDDILDRIFSQFCIGK